MFSVSIQILYYSVIYIFINRMKSRGLNNSLDNQWKNNPTRQIQDDLYKNFWLFEKSFIQCFWILSQPENIKKIKENKNVQNIVKSIYNIFVECEKTYGKRTIDNIYKPKKIIEIVRNNDIKAMDHFIEHEMLSCKMTKDDPLLFFASLRERHLEIVRKIRSIEDDFNISSVKLSTHLLQTINTIEEEVMRRISEHMSDVLMPEYSVVLSVYLRSLDNETKNCFLERCRGNKELYDYLQRIRTFMHFNQNKTISQESIDAFKKYHTAYYEKYKVWPEIDKWFDGERWMFDRGWKEIVATEKDSIVNGYGRPL